MSVMNFAQSMGIKTTYVHNSGLVIEDAKFPLGRLVITPGADAILDPELTTALLIRHGRGDWGDLGEDDQRENELGLRYGHRILSSYLTPEGKVWIITEWDRSVTTILLPEEY